MKLGKFLVFSLALMAVVAHAQTVNPSDDINADISPQNPGPNQQVTITLSSFVTNINAATISWNVNGKIVQSGKGDTTLTVTTGGMNAVTSVNITIKTLEGDTIQKNLTIRPTSVDLVWQADSYVPPFYKGKALFSHQNIITFIATPHIVSGGAEINPKNLIYKWTLNGSVVQNSSGYGKNAATFVGSIISRPLQVEVDVQNADGSLTASGATTVAPVDPTLVLYQIDPLYGIMFQKALHDSETLTGSQEMTVLGVPFYFGVYDPASPDLTYAWSINGNSVNNAPNDTAEIFRQKAGVSGSSNIGLSIENSQKILQTASASFNLTFGQPQNSALQF